MAYIPDRAQTRSGEPVTLPLRCLSCHGRVLVTYVAGRGPGGARETENIYTCPHCRKQVGVALPGVLLPPVDADDEPT